LKQFFLYFKYKKNIIYNDIINCDIAYFLLLIKYKKRYKKIMKNIWILFLLSTLSPLSIDLFVSIVPSLFNKIGYYNAYIIPIYIIGIGVGTLLNGYIYQKINSKKLLLFNLLLFTIINLFIFIIEESYIILIIRFMSGFLLSAVTIIYTSKIKENFNLKDSSILFAKINSVMNFFPMTCPYLGLIIYQLTNDINYIFLILSIFAVIIFFISYFKFDFPEKKINENNKNNIKINYETIGSILSLVILFYYVSLSSIIFNNLLNVNEKLYTFYFSFNGFLILIGGFLFSLLSKKYEIEKINTYIYNLILILSLITLFHQNTIILLFSIYCLFFPAIIGTTTMKSLEKSNNISKQLSIITFFQMILGGLIPIIITKLNLNEIVFFSILLIIIYITKKGEEHG